MWHRGLRYKLKHYGIGSKLLDLLENYMIYRRERVSINDSFLNTLFTNAGVPEWSVLGPIMFLIYINDIADNLVSITWLFADDTSLSSSSRQPIEIEDNLNKDLSEINNWSQKCIVKFNPSKTEVLLISIYFIPPEIHINFAKQNLEFSDFHKHVGVTFSANGKRTKDPSKTGALLISNSLIPPDIHIKFANEKLEFSDFHNYVGVTFSANGKWTKKIETIRDTAMLRCTL